MVENRTASLPIKSVIKRPQIVDMRDNVWFLHDGELLLYDIVTEPPFVFLTSKYSGQFDDDAPLVFHVYDRNDIRTETLFTCLNGKLVGIKIETLTPIIPTTFECGEYIGAGGEIIVVKNSSTVKLYKFEAIQEEYFVWGTINFYKELPISGSKTSETYPYDAIKMNRYDILYSIISDHNRIVVLDKYTGFEREEILANVPFYPLTTTEFLKPSINNLLIILVHMVK